MKRTLILSLLLAAAACAESPAESLSKAKAQLAKHDYAAARVYLAAYLGANPADRDARLLQAKALLALGDGDGAEAELARLRGSAALAGELAELSAEAALLRSAPDVALQFLGTLKTPESFRLRAMAALQKQDIAAAQKQFEAAVSAGGNGRSFADYARFHLMTGAIAEAQTMASRAAKVDPDGIDTLLVQGQLAVRSGDLAVALKIYERTAQLYPSSLAALTGQAAVLGDLGRLDEMDAVIGRAAVMAPKHPALVYLRAKGAAARGQWDKVRDGVQPVADQLGQLDPLRVIYADALLHLDLTEQAIAQLQPLVKAMPQGRDAARILAQALLKSGDPRAALAVIRPIADSPAARADDLALAATIAKAAGDPAAAQYTARAKQPAVQAAGRDLVDADAAMRAGNWAGAVQAYDRLLTSTDGTNPVVLNNLAYAQLMLGNGDKANQFADRALKAAPNHPSVLDTAGWVRFKTGQDKAGGLGLLRRAAALAPNNTTIRAHLAEAERAR